MVARAAILILALTFAAPAAAGPRDEIAQTLTQWRSAMRAGDGERACELMTTRGRMVLRARLDPDRAWDSCPELVGVLSKRLRAAVADVMQITRLRISGRRAAAVVRATDGEGLWFLRGDDGRWRLHYPSSGDLSDYPRPAP